jgi:hypothetical protein
MPIQFACIHCDQRLSVSQKKVGTQVECPQCKTPIDVPDEASAAEILQDRRRRRDAQQSNPFSQFAVFDEEPEIVYEHDIEPVQQVTLPTQEATVDPNRVAVPRLMIYLQGGLLAAVAIVTFTLGIMVGSAFGPSSSGEPAVTGPHVVKGAVYVAGNGAEPLPDVDALVLILPVDAKPEQRPESEGIRPSDPRPNADNPTLLALRQIGADYARTAADGTFQLTIPQSGKYYLLFISQEQKRGANQPLDTAVLTRLSGYVLGAEELIGNRAYYWQEERLRSDKTVTHVFE